jgi:hypothetical protein
MKRPVEIAAAAAAPSLIAWSAVMLLGAAEIKGLPDSYLRRVKQDVDPRP